MYLKSYTALAFALVVAALPQPEPSVEVAPPPTFCNLATGYRVEHVARPALVQSESTLGSVTCSGNGDGGCSLSHSNSYSVSVGYSVGGGLTLNLEDIFSAASLSASYTYTTTKGTIDSGTSVCPHGDWKCGLKITPWAKKVTGTAYQEWVGNDCGSSRPVGKHFNQHPYTVYYPQLATGGQPYVNTAVCKCPNAPHSAGGPPLCPHNC